MVERSAVNWEAEIAEEINRGRLGLLRDNLKTEAALQRTYNQIRDNIIAETAELFAKVQQDGKWNISRALKYKRLDELVNSINKRIIIGHRKDLKKIFKKELRSVISSEYSETQQIMNDFQLVNNVSYFKAGTSRFMDDMLKQPIQGLTYLQRLNKITGLQAVQMEEAIKTSITLGEGLQKTVNRIKKVSNIGAVSARRLAQTSVMQMSNQAHLEAFKRLKVVDAWKWSATLDSDTCPICGNQDGKVFPLSDSGLIPAHFNCRCTPIPVVKKEEWDKRGLPRIEGDAGKTRIARNPITGKNYKVPADTNYREWFKQQPAVAQKEILGPGKYDLWSKGDISFKQLAPRRQIVPLKTLRNRTK